MAKSFSFATMHFTVAFLVVRLLTGDFLIGGMVAIVEPAINTVAYYFHEKIWQKISADQSDGESPSTLCEIT